MQYCITYTTKFTKQKQISYENFMQQVQNYIKNKIEEANKF